MNTTSPSVQSPDLGHLGDSLELPCDYQCDPINVYSCCEHLFIVVALDLAGGEK